MKDLSAFRNRQEIEPLAPLREPILSGIQTLAGGVTLLQATEFNDLEIKHAWVSGGGTVDVHIVPDGSAASPANALALGLAVPGNDALVIEALRGERLGPLDSLVMVSATARAAAWGYLIQGEHG